MFFVALTAACVVTFICLYFGSRIGNQVAETPAAGERHLQSAFRPPKPAIASRVAQGKRKCALEYCKYYDDVAGGKNNCNPEQVKEYQKHWLLHGEGQKRHRCGNLTEICDGIWRGDFGEENIPDRIDIVVAHCKEDLAWLSSLIVRMKIVKKVTIISKCGRSTKLAPQNATVIRIPNVGRNDHTYLYYMVQKVLNDKTLDDKAVIFFVKGGAPNLVHRPQGTRKQHLSGFGFMPVLLPTDYALRIASKTGFSCLVEHYPSSLYHNTTVLNDFNLTRYGKIGEEFFKSNFSNLAEWLAWSQHHAHAILPKQRQIVPVCYEGNFVARVGNIRRQARAWKHYEAALRRGDNIEEGHFMERTWAMILKDEPGDIVLEIPHHAAQISKAYGSVAGRYASCTAEYRWREPQDVRVR